MPEACHLMGYSASRPILTRVNHFILCVLLYLMLPLSCSYWCRIAFLTLSCMRSGTAGSLWPQSWRQIFLCPSPQKEIRAHAHFKKHVPSSVRPSMSSDNMRYRASADPQYTTYPDGRLSSFPHVCIMFVWSCLAQLLVHGVNPAKVRG